MNNTPIAITQRYIDNLIFVLQECHANNTASYLRKLAKGRIKSKKLEEIEFLSDSLFYLNMFTFGVHNEQYVQWIKEKAMHICYIDEAFLLAEPEETPLLTVESLTEVSIDLSWIGSSNTYSIERSLFEFSGYTSILVTSENTFSDTAIDSGVVYFYRVKGLGIIDSEYSNIDSDSSSVFAPTNLAITLVLDTIIDLNWDDNSAVEVNYEVSRSLTPGSGFVVIETLPANSTTYRDTGLMEDVTYYYRVRALTSSGSSDYSNEILVTTLIPFTFDVKTDNAGVSSSNQFTLPLLATGTYNNMIVDWEGDGSNVEEITSYNQTETTHTYSVASTYTIKIFNQCRGWSFGETNNNKDPEKIINISKWGIFQPTNKEVFKDCELLDVTATDIIDLTQTTTLQGFFQTCRALIFNSSIGLWDISGITNLSFMFRSTPLFNQPIDSWDVSNVTTLEQLFHGTGGYSQSLSSWNVSNVTNMTSMVEFNVFFNVDLSSWTTTSLTNMTRIFAGATSFNQPLDSWDVSNVTNMSVAFQGATLFNQPLNSWDVSNVTNMSVMFRSASAFDQPLNLWDVSNVVTMTEMFLSAVNFDQDISSWDVSNVTNMSSMFFGTTFNQPLNTWNTISVTNMSLMFKFSAFDQPLNLWDVSNVVTMTEMFRDAPNFNQDISNWTTSSLTSVRRMLYETISFDQDLSVGNWDWTNITDATEFLTLVTMSTINYNALLVDIESQAVQNDVVFSGGNSTYSAPVSAASTARAALITDHNWTISDGGSI